MEKITQQELDDYNGYHHLNDAEEDAEALRIIEEKCKQVLDDHE